MSPIEELNARAQALEGLAERQALATERQANALERLAECAFVIASVKLAEAGQDSDDATHVFRAAKKYVGAGK